jgi:hypothetical protein
MARTSISVPQDLLDRLKPLKGPIHNLNISEICRNALEAKIHTHNAIETAKVNPDALPIESKDKAMPAIDMAPALSPSSTLEFFNFISAELTASRATQKDQENLIQRQAESIAHLHEKLGEFKKIKVSNETATLYQEYTSPPTTKEERG